MLSRSRDLPSHTVVQELFATMAVPVDGVIPDQTAPWPAVGHLHAESASNSAGTCAAIFVMSREFVSAGRVSFPVRYDGHLVDFAERLGKSAHHFRKPVMSLSITAAWLYS